MNIYLLAAVQYLHILFAIAWLGGALANRFLGTRALRAGTYPPEMAAGARRYYSIAAGMTVLLGIVRGVLQGVVPGSPYADTFIAALVLGVALIVWDARMVGPSYVAAAGAGAGERATLVARVERNASVSLAAFAVMLALMVAMRFGF